MTHSKFLISLVCVLFAIACFVRIAWEYRPAGFERDFAVSAPHLALPGVDLAHFEESIQLLERAANMLADLQDSTRDRRDVRDSLYPLSFLRAVGDLEATRRTFIASGTREDRNIYVNAERKTLRALRYDLARFERAFLRQVPESDAQYVAAGRMINRTALLESFSAMRQEISRTERDMRVRRWCSLGIFKCAILPIRMRTDVDTTTHILDMAQIRDTRDTMAEVLEQPDIRNGPIIETNGASCITRTGQANVFSMYDEQMPENMPHARRTMIASDIRFLRVSHFPQVPLYSLLADRGVEYVLASPLHHYTCMYEGEDAGRVAAIYAIHDTAQSSPLSEKSGGETKKKLRTMERALSGDVIRESDARTYIEAALDLSERDKLDAKSSLRAFELALLFAFKTSAIPDTLILLAKTELLDADAYKRGVPADLSAHNLFFSRSGFNATFMTHNPSIYAESPLKFDVVHVPPSREPYIYLSELPDTPAMHRTLIQDAREFITLQENTL